jgi:DNA-binding NtrC family response regulator
MTMALIQKSEGHPELALMTLDEVGRLLPRGRLGLSHLRLHLNRGLCFLKLGKFECARSSFMQAQLVGETNHRFHLISIYNNCGHVYRAEGRFELSVEYHLKALQVARTIGSIRQESLSLEFLGESHAEAGQLEQALAVLDEANELAKRIAGQGDLRMEVLRRRGEVLARLGRRSEALEDLERCISLCKARGEKREAILAERAHALMTSSSTDELAARAQAVLAELDRMSDRFEYVRTVALLLEDDRVRMSTDPWLAAAHATALHHAREMGIPKWIEALERTPAYGSCAAVGPQDTAEPLHMTKSWSFRRTLDAAQLAARGELPALILGETGAGKEVIAGLVHRWSTRSQAPFIAVNCGALPDSLVESELFGHAKGAFTGADRDKQGILAAANGGVVLLDEIADLPTMAQVKLLRFLDSGEVRRVGEVQPRRYDVRILASTNKKLEELVRLGRFREDLLYRLRAFMVEIPPLRDRREDILDLAMAFLRESSQSTLPIRISESLQSWMLDFRWPGNVRELRNLCANLSAKAWGKPEIDVADLPPQYSLGSSAVRGSPAQDPFDRERLDLERSQIERALKTADNKILEAARLLGMGRNTLARRIRAHGIVADQGSR